MSTTITCPVCGTVYHAAFTKTRTRGTIGHYHTMSDSSRSPFAESAPAVVEPQTGFSYRSMPVRSQDKYDFLNPAALALGSGLFLGLPGGLMASLVIRGISVWIDQPVKPPTLAYMGVGFVVSVGAVWIWNLRRYESRLMMVEEKEETSEEKPQPAPTPHLRVELEDTDHEGYRSYHFGDLPASKKKGYAGLNRFAQAISSQDESFAERQAQGFGGYTRDEWRELRGVFLDRGWANWNDEKAHNQGVTLTAAGRAIVRKIATSPLPRQYDDAL